MSDVVLDAGHGGKDPGAIGPTGIQEKECTLYIAKKCEEILKSQGITVKQTRMDDSYVGLSERAQIANSEGAKHFISIHINSADITAANGTEVYALAPGGEGEKLAGSALKYLVEDINLTNRGVKFANFAVLRETDMPAILVEVLFLSNPKEENLLKSDSFKDRIALNIAKGYLDYIGKPYTEGDKTQVKSDTLTPIIEEATELKDQAKQWAKNKNATDTFIALADLYWKLVSNHGGVNPVVAYAQAALETGFGKFGGILDESFRNPCGLKNSIGSDDKVTSHAKFNTWEEGVSAHLDHLALYAGANGYPRNDTNDQRHFPYLLGTVKYVEELSGKWSPTQDYGVKVINLMFQISDTIIVDNFNIVDLDNDIRKDNSNVVDKDVLSINLSSIREKLNNKNAELDKLKNEYEEIKNLLNGVDSEIEKLQKENKELKLTVDTLNQKNKKYQNVIEEVLNIVNKFK
ncbi:N-acetylmuramoyl-L-alanine amidase [Clostridium cavendishii DSM 21758]|uniref:N-acetylmuramoyl-L-alanine amidase n=1 Tax=Clostridium cavendishii DSM 21758 TaxID=1121302 RepID=A0A1M6TRJ7_9CLOT|nr:N-acetylmuramoyl-L-alanine amidase [Clostridium cavendishii]SHK59557.1 N-acetylmuramoyl-L-alanine amidase [Clostridium cavendishii DSM 21758]